jgi:structural maintenance of chromosome 4
MMSRRDHDQLLFTEQHGRWHSTARPNQHPIPRRANFLVLEKINETNGIRPIQSPKNIPRLFDLVKPKETGFAHPSYKALHSTLVARDLAQHCIAFGGRRWGVVTLAGDLIDLSGTVSGGGAKPRGGGMSSKLAPDAVQPDVLRKYE